MLAKHITTVLFDLDGTLLPMDQMGFTKTYFGLLVQKAAPFGLKPQPTIDAVWAGTKAMVKNDGSAPNDRRFWDTFCPWWGWRNPCCGRCSTNSTARNSTGQVRLRGEPLRGPGGAGPEGPGLRRGAGHQPHLPPGGGAHPALLGGPCPRGLLPGDHLREQHLCKPDPAYYREILEKLGKGPEECLMVATTGWRTPPPPRWACPYTLPPTAWKTATRWTCPSSPRQLPGLPHLQRDRGIKIEKIFQLLLLQQENPQPLGYHKITEREIPYSR